MGRWTVVGVSLLADAVHLRLGLLELPGQFINRRVLRENHLAHLLVGLLQQSDFYLHLLDALKQRRGSVRH